MRLRVLRNSLNNHDRKQPFRVGTIPSVLLIATVVLECCGCDSIANGHSTIHRQAESANALISQLESARYERNLRQDEVDRYLAVRTMGKDVLQRILENREKIIQLDTKIHDLEQQTKTQAMSLDPADSHTFESDNVRLAFAMALQKLRSSSDVSEIGAFKAVESTDEDYRVSFNATFIDDSGAMRTGVVICKVKKGFTSLGPEVTLSHK